jgi:hypothetical protein
MLRDRFELHGLRHGYWMTKSDLFIFLKKKKKTWNPAWVGWENIKIYVNAGFMSRKSRSNLGPAKWPLSISLNHVLPQSRRQGQSWDISVLSLEQYQSASPRLAPCTARQTGVAPWRNGTQSSRCLFCLPYPFCLHTGFSSWWVKPEGLRSLSKCGV